MVIRKMINEGILVDPSVRPTATSLVQEGAVAADALSAMKTLSVNLETV